jgi:exonuclease III
MDIHIFHIFHVFIYYMYNNSINHIVAFGGRATGSDFCAELYCWQVGRCTKPCGWRCSIRDDNRCNYDYDSGLLNYCRWPDNTSQCFDNLATSNDWKRTAATATEAAQCTGDTRVPAPVFRSAAFLIKFPCMGQPCDELHNGYTRLGEHHNQNQYGRDRWRHVSAFDTLIRQGTEHQPGPNWQATSHGVWMQTADDPTPVGMDIPPTPFSIVSRNIRGLTHHIDEVLAAGNDVTALQETDVLETDVTWLKARARAKGYSLHFAQTTGISKDGITRRGRRTAILVKEPAKPKIINDIDDPTCQALEATGRWIELLIPLHDGDASFIITSAYGFAGASAGGDDYVANETFVALLAARAAQRKRAAQVICTDLNIDPIDSEVTIAAIDSGLLRDIPNDWFEDRTAPPTYCLTGVTADMHGSGVTRIDTILANPVFAHQISKLFYDYESAKGYDHVAITMYLDVERFNDTIMTLDKPALLKIPKQPTGIEGKRHNEHLNEKFNELWQEFDDSFDVAIASRNLDAAHFQWSLACETFLWRYCNADWQAHLPTHKPTRGEMLPMVERKAAANFYAMHDSAAATHDATTADITAQLHDLRWKIQRWTTPAGQEVRDNQLDIPVHINIDIGKIQGAHRTITDGEIQNTVNLVKKLATFNKLADIGLPGLSRLDQECSISITAQEVLDARDRCHQLRRAEAQRSRNDKADEIRRQLDPANDPHARRLYQFAQKTRSPPTSTMWDDKAKGFYIQHYQNHRPHRGGLASCLQQAP